MPALDASLRSTLETLIVKARDTSEAAAEAALRRLAVHEAAPYPSMSEEARVLRRHLRAKARQLSDPLEANKQAPMAALVRECAYEKWHAMLFAAFLAENHLLMHPEGVAVTLEDCEELARDEGDADGWATAARYASVMLPGIFRVSDPLLRVPFAPEDRKALEALIATIPKPTYGSDDGLGWVYQFWQTKAKKEVNRSGRKIGGADIPAVTQLFTEHYMVQFLLHNTLGAWWASRHPDRPLPTDKSYLRFADPPGLTATPLDKGGREKDHDSPPLPKGGQGGIPAAGRFEGWPDEAKDLKLMDPCCGSGHFLVAAFALLKRFRMIEEGLSEREAGDAVIRDNLHGLEIDPRCTQLAAFNLALEAWKSGGYRELPPMNIACSGISVGGQESEWTKLAGDDPRLAKALSRLYHLFKNAPDLGSLIDPTKLDEGDHLYTASFEEVEGLLEKALARAKAQDDPVAAVFGEAAAGITKAAQLLKGKYHAVITNVPYLTRGKQGDTLRDYIERTYPLGKADIATAFVERCRDFCSRGGSYALVTPQNWLFLGSYKGLRELLLKSQSWNIVAKLGEGGFQSSQAAGAFVALYAITNAKLVPKHIMTGMDVSDLKTPEEKDDGLREREVQGLEQMEQLRSPHRRIVLDTESSDLKRLGEYAGVSQGISPGDTSRFVRFHWEMSDLSNWRELQSTPDGSSFCSGASSVIFDPESPDIQAMPGFRFVGQAYWGREGIAVGKMRGLPVAYHTGSAFDANCPVLFPKDTEVFPAIWCYVTSGQFARDARKLDQKLDIAVSALTQVPFNLEHWQKVAAEKYPDGLPEPYSNDPTQWLFNGSITESTEPLQVAVARLLGYSWPEQGKSTQKHPFPESEKGLDDLIDKDGIVCLPSVAGEKPAAERLRALLARAYGAAWSPAKQSELLASVGYDGKDLDDWLWGDFFKQHCKLFNNRPFIWHITDGRKDGFSALVNYHGLDRQKLERLIYTYLGAYIQAQGDAARAEVRGADLRLAAAQELKGKLEAILQGEPPYDIYVRWKLLREQPLGWEPDLNDGVRLNIRPFVTAGVLRARFTINWNKDRGTDPKPNASGTTERLNDLHFTRAQKLAAREQVGAD